MLGSFEGALNLCLRSIPRGRVATCGTVARALGDPRAARAVATWLLEHPGTEGGHRVVRADGRPVLPDALRLLNTEGTALTSGRVDGARVLEQLPRVRYLEELRETQRRLASRVREEGVATEPETLGGVDVSYAGDHAYAVGVLLNADGLEILEVHATELDVDFPYIPTYLAFREFPAIERVMHRFSRPPDVLFVDGHGRLHPRLFGVACFVGVQLGLPTIGIAKHALAGTPVAASRSREGAIAIEIDGIVRGYAWTPPGRSRPFYVSVGNEISLEEALRIAQEATRTGYPEPLRAADRLSKEKKKQKNGERNASGQAASKRPPCPRPSGRLAFLSFLALLALLRQEFPPREHV